MSCLPCLASTAPAARPYALASVLFLRRILQRRQGQTSTDYALAETFRTPTGRVRPRTICSLGRLDNLRPPDGLRIAERLPDPAWLPLLMQEVGYTPPQHPAGPVPSVCIEPHALAWCNPRRRGDVYVALRAGQLLGLDRLLGRRLGRIRTRVPLAKVAAMIAVNRLVEPKSERGIFHWLPRTALFELLDVPRGRLGRNARYRCLSEVVRHNATLEKHLVQQGHPLFAFRNDLLLYDRTRTYFAGRLAGNPKAQRGYSRDHRRDGKQRCIGLVVNRNGFPLGVETLPGNSRDAATLTPLISALEARCGGARRVVCFDRGMATEANLQHWRQTQRLYRCAVRRAVTRQYLAVIRQGPWQTVRAGSGQEPGIEVQALPDQEHESVRERWLLCRRAGCQAKDRQMFAARLLKVRERLARLRAQVAAGTLVRAQVIQRKARQAVGRRHDLRGIFSWQLHGTAAGLELRVAADSAAIEEHRDLHGVYLLPTTEPNLGPLDVWHTYRLLTRVEAAFRKVKSAGCLRPIFHHKEARADAHVLFAVRAYALSVTLQLRHRRGGGEQTTAAMRQALEQVQLAELSFRTAEGERLRLERASLPTAAPQGILDSLGWAIPEQYLPPNLDTEPARL